MSRISNEAGVVDGDDQWMSIEKGGNRFSRPLLIFNARKQRAKASQRQIRIERRPRDSGLVSPFGEGRDVCFGGGYDCAADRIRVTV